MEVIDRVLEQFNSSVKFNKSSISYRKGLYEYLIIKYNKITNISYTNNSELQIYLKSDNIDSMIRLFNVNHKLDNAIANEIFVKIFNIIMSHIENSDLSNKQLEEISKKMDTINEKLDAIVYAPGSSLYKEIASKYAKDEKM